MASIKGSLRSISGASIETGVPVSTIRDWDGFIQPHRISNGTLKPRYYDDSHIARILKMLELNKASREGQAVAQQSEALRA